MAFIAGGGWFTGTYPVQVPFEINIAPGTPAAQVGRIRQTFLDGIGLWNDVENPTLATPTAPARPGTGVRLVQRTNEPAFLSFVNTTNGGCNSPVGRQPAQPQPVACDFGGRFDAVVVAHEIGHALGLLHEHQRPERDQHITLTEVPPATGAINGPNYQFIPELTPLRNVLTLPDGTIATVVDDYDCASIMHYPVRTFAGVNVAPGVGCPSLANAQTAISDSDIMGVRALYGSGVGAINVTYTRYPISSDGWHLTRARRARRKALRRRRGLRGTLLEDVIASRNPTAPGATPTPAGYYDDVFARKRDLSGFPIFFGYDFEARDVLVYWQF